MNRPTRILLTATFSLLSVLTAHAAPTRITSPQIITLPGSYVLVNDITRPSGGAIITIDIQASDVTLNLNGHTINANGGEGILIDSNDINNNRSPVVNVHVSNGQIVGASYGVTIYASSCLINGLNITVGATGTPILIEHGNSNSVHSCVLSAATGQTGSAVFSLFLTSHNTIQNNTITGVFDGTIDESDQVGTAAIAVGDNTFSGNEFANPTQ
jgi:hypothetical protein